MYKYQPPIPIVIDLNNDWGMSMRQAASDYIEKNRNNTGAERGSTEEQGFGALAEIAIRNKLGMPNLNPGDHPLAFDILLPSKVKLDVKCRGGERPFKEMYPGSDGLDREAKHNLFARQIFNDALDTDIYLMTHLETPKKAVLPGTRRQKKWKLYVCGWVSKTRAKREGVFLPRGSLTEQGSKWFNYRGQEIEFYNRNLNGLSNIDELLTIDANDVLEDSNKKGGINLTSVDATRIAYDLVGRGVLNREILKYVKENISLSSEVKPMLHINQYYHFLDWLKDNSQITEKEIDILKNKIPPVEYDGL